MKNIILFSAILLIANIGKAQWESIPSPLNVNILSKAGDYLFISSISDSALIRHNLNNNNQIIMINPDNNLPFLSSAPKALISFDSVIFYTAFGYIYRTFDFGNTWEKCYNNHNSFYNFITSYNLLFVGTPNQILLSEDLGNTFNSFYYENYYTNTALTAQLVIDSVLYFTEQGGLLTKHLLGSASTINNTPYFLSYMTAKDSIVFGSKNSTLWKSDNYGFSWNINQVPFSPNTIMGVQYNNGILYLICGNGIFCSIDDGVNWLSMNDNLPSNASLRCITFDENNIYVGTFNCGAFKRQLLTNMVDKDIIKSINVYPNPVNDKITIQKNDNIMNEITVSIFNINGLPIMTEKYIDKKYIELDVHILSKGIYLLKIQDGIKIEINKLIIQ